VQARSAATHGEHVVDVLGAHVDPAHAATQLGGGGGGLREPFDLLEPAGLADRDGVLATHLEAVVLGGIVGGRQHDPAAAPEVIDGEVEHRRADESEVYDVRVLVRHATHQRLEQLRRAAPRVAPDGEARSVDVAGDPAPDPVGGVGIQFVGDHAANVVGLEDGHGVSVLPPRGSHHGAA
jgi:hypothetical protein